MYNIDHLESLHEQKVNELKNERTEELIKKSNFPFRTPERTKALCYCLGHDARTLSVP